MKKKLGTKAFCILYNIIGLLGLNAAVYGFIALSRTTDIRFTMKDLTQAAVIIVTVLLFASSYLLIKKHKGGIILPAFVLAFMITGGVWGLIPVLAAHVWFFTHPKMQNIFA